MKSSLHQSGFTLIELFITISIATIMLALATPSFTELYYNNRSLSFSNDLRVALYRAQNEAIRRNRVITVKAKTSTNSPFWEGGWDIYLDANNNNTVDAGEEIISSYVPKNAQFTLKANKTAIGSEISFDALGMPNTNGEFWICRPDNNATKSMTVKVGFSGFISVKKGATCS